MIGKRLAGALLCVMLGACVSFPEAPAPTVDPAIIGDALRAVDGAALGLEVFRADAPVAAVVAAHGMNDYAGHFRDAARWLATQAAISVYAYDQRGFGRSPDIGRWPGAAALGADLRAAIAAVRRDNPGLPVFVLGHSMGAAVVMTAAAKAPLEADGVILAAPGVWGGSRMPIAYRFALNVSASLAPGKTLTGERAGRQASDNIAALREMYEDPLVIKPTRLDAILGVERLMGDAWGASDDLGGKVLFLYGSKDQIIPPKTMRKAAARLCGDVDVRVYEEGWHLLLRDLKAERVYRDIADWVAATAAQTASAAGRSRFGPAALLCEREAKSRAVR
jgi:alpha-beta hydrolase superfamily lysophospholipase